MTFVAKMQLYCVKSSENINIVIYTNIFMRILLVILVAVILSGCKAFKADVDPITGKKIRKAADLMKNSKTQFFENLKVLQTHVSL